MRNSSVEISTGLLVDPLVGLRILRGSSSHKMILDCSCTSRIESCFSFILSVSGDQQIRKRVIESRLVKGT